MVDTAEEFLHLYLALELHHTVDDCLRTRRTARDIDIHRDDFIDTAHDMIAVLERTSRYGTSANSHDIFRFGHLVVQTFQGRSHLVRNRTGTHNQVGLAGRVACHLKTET